MKYYFIYLGRLDQWIHIPLPDDASRVAILEVFFKKSSAVKDIDMNYFVDQTEGLSSGILIKICQKAHLIAKTEATKIESTDEQEQLTLIKTEHFIKANKFAGFKS